MQIIDLKIFTEAAKVIATGQLMNQSTGEVLAADYSTPTIYGLDESGKWVTLIHRGTLTPAWDTGAVSPAGFVLEPGAGADFEMEGELDGLEQVDSWYPVPAPDLLWNEHTFYQECPGPGAGYLVPAPAG